MKALWLREVQAVLRREDFGKWWQSLLDLEQKVAAIRARHVELLAQVTLMEFRAEFTQKNAIDSLYLAGEYEDTAAQLLAEASEIENKSYEAVANFESHRIAVSDLFSRMGAVEHNFLNAQAEIRSLKTAGAGARSQERHKDLDRKGERRESDLARLEKELRDASAAYERGNLRKMSLWEEVEQMWARSLDINLGVSERRIKAKRARREAERLFKEAEQHKQQVAALKQEAEEAILSQEEFLGTITELRRSARRLFGCLVGEEFLYWPRRESVNEVYCVSINDHSEGFNIELHARSIYLISRQRGVEFIEPLPPAEGVRDNADGRIDDFFIRDENDQAASD